MVGVLDRTDWKRRGPDVGELTLVRRASGDEVIAFQMGFAGDHEVARTWQGLRHENLLEPLIVGSGPLHLRYAAIDWLSPRHRFLSEIVAARGAELARLFQYIVKKVPEGERGWLACPFAIVDIDRRVRVGFEPPDASEEHAARVPPEVIDGWPRCDERALVYVVGQLLTRMMRPDAVADETPFNAALARCLEWSPRRRFATLEQLRGAMIHVGDGRGPARRSMSSAAFVQLELGCGHFHLGDPQRGRTHLVAAIDLDPTTKLARRALAEVDRRWPDGPAQAQPQPRGVDPAILVWAELGPIARDREGRRDFRGALEILRAVGPEDAERVEVRLAIARCCLATGELGDSIDQAQRVLGDDPASAAAHDIRAHALLQLRKHADALRAAESWLTVTPGDGRAHHARAKALLALGRAVDARASFDRASELAPGLVAAAMLRANLDRSAKALRTHVGVDPRRGLDVPAHLAELAPLIAADRIADAIAWLATRTADPVAHRFLASCHEYAGDHRAALAVYDELGDAIGAGRCLVTLDRLSEALVVLGELDDPEALDLRATALGQLGRTEEAARLRSQG